MCEAEEIKALIDQYDSIWKLIEVKVKNNYPNLPVKVAIREEFNISI